MSNIEISEGHVPIPKREGNRSGRPPKYPFGALADGGVMLMTADGADQARTMAAKVRSAATAWRTRNAVACRFAVRILPPTGDHGYRVGVWRFAPAEQITTEV